MYIEGEVPYGNNNNGFGNGWEGLIGLALVAGLFDGGFGFGGNRGYAPAPATQADLAAGFNNSAVLSSLNDIKLGQASAVNYNNQGFAGLNQTITNGFSDLNTALCGFNYNVQGSFNSLSHQLSDCCCTTQRAIDSVKYENAKNTCDIIRAGQDNTRAILDYLTTEKISSLQAENSGLKAQISNDMQTSAIVNALSPKAPVPAYPVFPATSFAHPTGVAFGWGTHNDGCGCNNF
jgi:hypothetical protein